MVISDIDYFDYGLPPDNESNVYGLYSYSLDRIIAIHHNTDLMKQVMVLLSPKIRLQIINLSSAKNFSPNIIDNSVCYNWSVEYTDFVGVLSVYNKIIFADSLYEIENSAEGLQNLQDLAKWTQLTFFYCDIFNNIKKYQFQDKSFNEAFMTDMLDIPKIQSRFREVEKTIYKTIYFENDYQTANEKILAMVNSYPRLSNTIMKSNSDAITFNV